MKKTLLFCLLFSITFLSFANPNPPVITPINATTARLSYKGYEAIGTIDFVNGYKRFTLSDNKCNEYLHFNIVNNKPTNLTVITIPEFLKKLPTCLAMAVATCQSDNWCDIACWHGTNPGCILGWIVACNTGGLE